MKSLLFSIALLFVFQFSHAQINYVIADKDGVKISVKGSSTLHDWEAVASEVSDYPKELSAINSGAINFEAFGFNVLVESLDGGRGASMNKKITKALLAADHPNIIFDASEITLHTEESDVPNVIKSKGQLQLAGKSLEVDVEAKFILGEKELIISGSKPLKMSDFGIEPPSAMFGQIQTRDDITVHFEFRYISKS